MKLVYDTETTGLPDFKKRSNDPEQPHLVQLALIEFDDDGNQARHRCVLVRPDGWEIPEEVTAIHGITQERAAREGIPEDKAVALYIMAQGRADIRVAHNESFDRRIMRIAMTRAGYAKDFILAIEGRESFCTMNASRRLVNLPPSEKMMAKNMTQPKPPSLAECIQHFFGEKLAGAHDALIDAQACARIYFHILAMEREAEAAAPAPIPDAV